MFADWLYRGLQIVLRPLFIGFFGIKSTGFESIPTEGPLIIICNHVSGFDPPVVGTLVRRPLYYMTKAELFRFRPLGFLIRLVHAYPVKRGKPDRQALRTSLSLLTAGRALLIFPEGHRTATGDLQPARSGSIFLSKRTGAKIVPIGIAGAYGFRRGTRYSVGEAFAIPEEMPTGDAQYLLVEKIREQIERGRKLDQAEKS